MGISTDVFLSSKQDYFLITELGLGVSRSPDWPGLHLTLAVRTWLEVGQAQPPIPSTELLLQPHIDS